MHAPTKGSIHDPAWRAFAAWCRRLALRPLPAHPWTVGAFLLWCDERPGAVAVTEAVGAIATVHVRRGYDRPERHLIVRRTLAALARRHGAISATIVPIRSDNPAAVKTRSREPFPPRVPRVLRSRPKLVARRDYRVH
ncbi:MAG: hypothetical protein FJX37_07600 [Alphaproteobacteria bacterium]|nr:hypothetical protein [Alphaproteobacteria bacterium]MBM3732892.1 hypothetical protein [Acidimicrobiia bacterium]